MLLLCFLYTKPIILYFSDFCISNDDLFHSILQLFKISRPVFLYSKRFTNEFILQIYFILISFISIIIFLTFFDLYFLKSFFFFFLTYCLLKVVFIKLPIPYFLVKKSGKIYFLKHNQLYINLSQRLMFGLPPHTIFSVTNWTKNTNSSFPLVNW